MSYTLRGAALATVAVLVAATGGCSNTPSNNSSSGSASGGGATVVTVNGEAIPQSDLFVAMVSHATRQGDPPEVIGKVVLTQLINAKLTEQLAKKDGVAPTQQQIDAAYNNRKLLSDVQSTIPFDTALGDSLMTPDEYKQIQIVPIVAQLNLYTKGETVADQEILAYYNSHKGQAPISSPARAHIRHIIVANQADAQGIYNQIKGGKQFEELVSSSLDHSSPNGEVFQWVPLSGQSSPQIKPIVDAINATGEGEVAPPVKIDAGGGQAFWIVKVVEKKPAEIKTLDEVKDVIRETLLMQKGNQNFMTTAAMGKEMADFEKTANIVAVDTRYQPVIDDLKAQIAAQSAAAPGVTSAAPTPAPGQSAPGGQKQ